MSAFHHPDIEANVGFRPVADFATSNSRAHHPAMANSLDLDPEWGAIDLIEEVEAVFGFAITKDEAERCATVGDLHDLVCVHTPAWDRQNGNCGSSMVFYRVRRSLCPDGKRGVTPDTPLTAIGLQPSGLFKKLADDTGLRFPAYKLTWPGLTGGFLLVGGIIAAIVVLLTGHSMVGGVIALIALAGLPLMRADPGRWPVGVVTIGDLVRRTVPLNAVILKEAGGQPADCWSVIIALATEYGTLAPHEIGPETFFHRKSLKLASDH